MCLRLPGVITVDESARLGGATRAATLRLVRRGLLRSVTILRQIQA